MEMMEGAAEKEFDQATEEERKLWKCYVMEILPCAYGRGAENYWKKYLDRESRGRDVGLASMIDDSDHAIALAAMETKREEVVENRERRSERGASPSKDRKLITMERYAEHFRRVTSHVPRMKALWANAFRDWATDKYSDGNGRSSSSEDDSTAADGEAQDALPLYNPDAFNRFLENISANAIAGI